MGATGGRRRAESAPSTPNPITVLAVPAAGALVGLAVWYLLVRAAIDFGGDARDGRAIAWLFMLVATVGAIACLVLVLVLVTRGLTAIGLLQPKSDDSDGGGHRAAHK